MRWRLGKNVEAVRPFGTCVLALAYGRLSTTVQLSPERGSNMARQRTQDQQGENVEIVDGAQDHEEVALQADPTGEGTMVPEEVPTDATVYFSIEDCAAAITKIAADRNQIREIVEDENARREWITAMFANVQKNYDELTEMLSQWKANAQAALSEDPAPFPGAKTRKPRTSMAS